MKQQTYDKLDTSEPPEVGSRYFWRWRKILLPGKNSVKKFLQPESDPSQLHIE